MTPYTDISEDVTENNRTERSIWVNNGAAPPSDTHTEHPTVVEHTHKETYEEVETVKSVNDDGYTLYDEHNIHTSYDYEDKYTTRVDVTYESVSADPQYTNLIKSQALW